VTRGTRPKKPSSSRSFAREARGAQGSWRLKTENQNFFFSFPAGNNYQKNILFYFLNIRADSACQRGRKAGGGQGGRERREGEEGEGGIGCVQADGFLSADVFFTIDADDKNPSVGKNASAG
jgi:hypothetical protein